MATHMQPTKILSIAAYRRQPWPEHTRRVVAASMVNLGVRRRRTRWGLVAWWVLAPPLAWALVIWAGAAVLQ